MQTFTHQLIDKHELKGERVARLWAGLHCPPDNGTLVRRWMVLLSTVAGLFAGLGVIFWVAANWQDWTRGTKLLLLQALLLGSVLGAVMVPRSRLALLLLATLLLGGLLALVGQTYQTGADSWQLFAAWAVLSVLWVIAAQRDALWTFWVLIVATGIGLWSGSHVFNFDVVEVLFGNRFALGFAMPCLWAGLVVISVLAARYAIFLRAEQFATSARVAMWLALMAWCGHAVYLVIAGVFQTHHAAWATVMQVLANAGFILATGIWLRTRLTLDIAAFSMVVLASNVLVLAIIGRLLAATAFAGDAWILRALAFGSVALLLLGLSGKWLLKLQLQAAQAHAKAARLYSNEFSNEGRMAQQALAKPGSEQWVFDRALSLGVLSADAVAPELRPDVSWVVTAMSFIGAQFAVVPFFAVMLTVMSGLFDSETSTFIVGLLCIAIALTVIASQSPTAAKASKKTSPQGFVAQLGFTVLLIGTCMLMFSKTHWAVVGGLLLGAALMARLQWIQSLVAFLGGLFLANAIEGHRLFGGLGARELGFWQSHIANAPLFLALLWAAWVVFEPKLSQRWGRPSIMQRLSLTMDGVAAAVLVTVAYRSGSLLYGNAKQGSVDSSNWGSAQLWQWNTPAVIQALLALVLGVYVAQRWHLFNRTQRSDALKRHALALLSIAFCAWAVLNYAAQKELTVCLIATLALVTARKRLLSLAMLVLLVQLSGFYYALQWTLADKAQLLIALGAVLTLVLAASHWLWGRRLTLENAGSSSTHSLTMPLSWLSPRRMALAIAMGGAIALSVIELDVQGKEQVIAQGRKIYIPLAPRDPRSMMQGDYMALNFGPRFLLENRTNTNTNTQGTHSVWARLDDRGVATLLEGDPSPDQAMSNNHIQLPMVYKNGGWVIVTDAYYFPEGQGEPFAKTRFGEFRSLPDGRALLVGLADEALNPIQPALKKMHK